MSEAVATPAPAAPAPPPEGGTAAPPTPKETPAEKARRIKADLGDGEQEYDLDTIIGNAKKGRNAAQLASAAEKKAREAEQRFSEAQKKQAELDGMWETLKDPAKARKFLREKGVDIRKMSIDEINEEIEAEKKAAELSPEAKRVKELEEKLAAQEAEKQKATDAEKQKAWQADFEKHVDEFSKTFMEISDKAGLPKGSARRAFPYIAKLYELAQQDGKALDPDLVANHVRERFQEEHEWLFRDPKTKALNIEALQARFSPDDWTAIQRYAVKRYQEERAKSRGGTTMPPPSAGGVAQPTVPAQKDRAVGTRLFRDLENRFK